MVCPVATVATAATVVVVGGAAVVVVAVRAETNRVVNAATQGQTVAPSAPAMHLPPRVAHRAPSAAVKAVAAMDAVTDHRVISLRATKQVPNH